MPLPFSVSAASIRTTAAVCAGVLASLATLELGLRPIARQLRVPPRPQISCDSVGAPVVETRQTEEGIALARYSVCGARLTGHAPVAGAPYVVLLGDSYVAAREVNDDETMGSQLEDIARDSARPINVRQYGWLGASPAQYLLVAADVLRRWQPTHVVVVLNDDDLGASALTGMAPRMRLLDGGRVAIDTGTAAERGPQPGSRPNTLALRGLMQHRWALVVARSPAIIRRAFGSPDAGPSASFDEQVLPALPEATVRSLSSAFGPRLLIVYLANVRVTGGDETEPLESQLLSACTLHGVQCVSTRHAMLEARRAGTAVRGFSTTVAGDGHLNAAGHRLVARAIWAALRSRKESRN